MTQLESINFSLPTNNHRQIQAFNMLAYILTSAPSTVSTSTISLANEETSKYLPTITFAPCKQSVPEVKFTKRHIVALNTTPEEIKSGRKTLSLEEINQKFAQHITGIDHVGINITPITENASDKDTLIYFIGSNSHLYRYPTGEPWYFVIPASRDELKVPLTDFSVQRPPKFEVVLDPTYNGSTIQIDIQTKLSRAQVEDLLPAPFGFSAPETAPYFRSVYAENPWHGLEIRLDLRFADSEHSDWKSGAWLAHEAMRVK